MIDAALRIKVTEDMARFARERERDSKKGAPCGARPIFCGVLCSYRRDNRSVSSA